MFRDLWVTIRSEAYITPPDEPSPLFVVNIPMGRLPSKTLDYSKYSALFELIRTESFGDTDEESAETVKTKVAVVLGINQVKVIAKYNDPLTDAQTNLLNTARGKLFNLGMGKSTVDLIQETAKRSGAAIHQILQMETQ